MSEKDFYNEEFTQRPEHNIAPEHTTLPEYNPVYPDVTFFKESSVTCREENIFQGRPPAGEDPRLDERAEKRKRNRYSILQQFLRTALRSGAAVLTAVAVVAAITSPGDTSRGRYAASISDAFKTARNTDAFTQQIGYAPEELARLWQGDPDAPHKYDYANPLIFKEATCTEDGETEYVCLECGVHAHGFTTAAGHKEGDPIHENEVAATCLAEGSYIRIIKCKVCGEELSRETITVAKAAHTPGEPEISDEKEATCTEDGSYEEVIVCSVCGEEISRQIVTVTATGHTPAEAARQHEIEATCTEAGSYEEVIICADCGEEISRREVSVAALGHSAAAAVKENETAATCTEGGHYDSVVYCSRCGEEMTRSAVTSAALGHSAGSAVRENETAATCTEGGHYENVVYCSRCQEEMSRSTVTTAALGHSAGSAVKENETAATCTEGGHYENVVYCSRCQAEMSRSTVTTAATGHTIEAVREDEVPATCTEDGHFTEVHRCSVCGYETLRQNITDYALGHNYQQEKQIESGNECVGFQYYYLSKCTRCGELEPNTGPSVPEWEDGIGHDYPSAPPNGQAICGRCGSHAIEAWYYDNYIHYTLDENYLYETLAENGYEFSGVKLYSYSAGGYINEGGYEWGADSEITVPENFRVNGERFRVDFYFGNSFVSSNDVTYTD